MRRLLASVGYDDTGAAAMEYGLIAALIVLCVVAGMSATGTSVSDLYRATFGLIAATLFG